MNLMDVQNVASKNKGFRFILLVMDLFSRYLYAVPLKTKDMNAVESALAKCFKEAGQYPTFILADRVSVYYLFTIV